jgi:hypothetical protein
MVLGVLAVGYGATGSAVAATAPSPIQVEVTGGTSAPMEGEQLSYTVHIRDTTAIAFPHAVVWQLFPAGFKVTGSVPMAQFAGAGPEWNVALPAGGSAQFTDTVLAGTAAQVEEGRFITVRQPRDTAAGRGGPAGQAAPAPGAQPFSTTVCVRESAQGPILACASADQTLALRPASAADGGMGGLALEVGVPAAAVGGAATVLVVRRRRRRSVPV